MEQLIRSTLENKKPLTQLYLKNRLEQGEGIMMILQKTSEEDSVTKYIVIQDLPAELLDEYYERKIENGSSDNVIFFYLCTMQEASLMAFNLDDRDWV